MPQHLIASVSGLRGVVGVSLVPELVARYAAAFGWLMRRRAHQPPGGKGGRPTVRVVLARDARVSGPMLEAAARAGLQSVGVTVVECGLVPTPTAQLAVEHHGAAGGLVITASHNPAEWNALKFIGPDGIFLAAADAGRLGRLAEQGAFPRAGWNEVGGSEPDGEAVERHVNRLLALGQVPLASIRRRRLTVALDCVRGAGGTIMPLLLRRLGCRVVGIGLEPDGRFPRPPEPLPEHLGELGELVRRRGADLGMAVDPDVDRLALVDERGEPIGEDYTLALAVLAVLGGDGPAAGGWDAGGDRQRGRRGRPVVVCNLSTSLVVEAAARSAGARVVRSPVGEANVARAMRRHRAVIGGEGNGGVILPALHLGRDAPVGAALVLGLLAHRGMALSEVVAALPRFAIVKARAPRGRDVGAAYAELKRRFARARVNEQDGLRLAWKDRWLHVRPSGTEPIVRLIAEAPSRREAAALVAAARQALVRERTAVCAG
jgi:phosphomannomutase